MGQFVEQGYEFDLTADEVDRRLMLIGDFSRPNLLHNSRFQVNQRSLQISSGITTTSIANEVANNVIMAGSFIVDRWHTVNSGVVYTYDAGHYIKALNHDGTNGGASLKQKIWSPKFTTNSNIMFDEDVTISILYSDGNLFTGTGHTVKHTDFTSANEGAIVGGYIDVKDNDNNNVAYIICRKDVVSKSRAACAFELHIMGRNASIIAAKVEIGVGQTLAKKMGNKWVLIDQYDYYEDLRNCQRFYYNAHITTAPKLFAIRSGMIVSYLEDIDRIRDMIFTPTATASDFYGIFNTSGKDGGKAIKIYDPDDAAYNINLLPVGASNHYSDMYIGITPPADILNGITSDIIFMSLRKDNYTQMIWHPSTGGIIFIFSAEV